MPLFSLIAAILASAPELISDVEKLIESLKSGAVPVTPLTPEVHAAMDEIHTRIMLAAIAARAKG